jgi:hypothetical protein
MHGTAVTLRDKLDGIRVVRPRGISALSFFLLFGMTMSALAAVSLALPGGVLEPIWKINRRGREVLGALGLPAVILMATVSVACAGAAAGLWLGRRWGWWAAMTILLLNVTGDLLIGILGSDPRTLVGLPVAAAMLYYLWTARVRAFFGADRR